jgi:hypothetical protein
LLRFQAFIVFKGKNVLKIHFRGWSNKWDEEISESRFEYRLRPRTDSTAIGAENYFETFDDVGIRYCCRKFKFCAVEEPTSIIQSSTESSDPIEAPSLQSAESHFLCEEIDACDAAGQWYRPTITHTILHLCGIPSGIKHLWLIETRMAAFWYSLHVPKSFDASSNSSIIGALDGVSIEV